MYWSHTIKDYCNKRNIQVDCIFEKKPLGTFGALMNVSSTIYQMNI